MQKRNLFLLILAFSWLQTSLHAQTPLYRDSLDLSKFAIERCEILNAADSKLITDSITHVAVRHKINMYRQLYNIDSIFHDTPSMNAFLQNPYILEYPRLKGYEYWPEYEVSNMLDMSLGSDENTTYCQRGFFKIRKFDCFIRKADMKNGIKADTFGRNTPGNLDCYTPTSICGWSDHHYAVYFNSFTKELKLLGGCLPVEQIKETNYNARYPYEGYSILYASTRLIQKTYNIGRRAFLHSPPPAFLGQKYIEKYSNLGSITDKNKKYFFYGFSPSPNPHNNMYQGRALEYWLIIAHPPAPVIEYIASHTGRRFVLDPPELWDNIEMIRFIPTNYVNDDKYNIRPTGKFPYYEERITIKNNPGPKDCLVHFRGVTQEEMEELKKLEGMDELLYECKRKQF